jgi:polar amino acid transport system substrate-binding protein
MAFLTLLFALLPPAAEASESNPAVDETGRALPVLRGGWFLWNPYQFLESREGNRKLTGMDVDFTRALAHATGFEVDYSYRPWHQHIAQLRNGAADIASGATWAPERAAFMHYSKPYRQETNVLYLPRGVASRHRFSDTGGMLQMFRSSGFRLGVISGYVFADPAINAYVADPENAARITFADNDYDNFRNLMSGRIDGFIADRLVAATTAWRGGWRDKVEEHPVRITVDIHLVFSKATVPVETVQRFDQAIQTLQNNGETQRIFGHYIAPLLLAQAIDRSWFALLDVIGTIAFALSGILIAARERYSLLGALILAALPAVGAASYVTCWSDGRRLPCSLRRYIWAWLAQQSLPVSWR